MSVAEIIKTYGAQVGKAWVSLDFEAQALTVTMRPGRVDRTDEVAPGVLIDWNADGEIVAVEVIAPRGEDPVP